MKTALKMNPYRSILWGIPTGLLLGVVLSAYYENAPSFILNVFGGRPIGDIDLSFILVMDFIPFVIAIFLFSGMIKNDFYTASVFIFTRARYRVKWHFKKIAIILFYVCSFGLVLYLSSIIGFMAAGKGVYDVNLLITILKNVLLQNVLYNFLIIILINVLSIQYDLKMSLASVLTICVIYPLFVDFLYKSPIGKMVIVLFPFGRNNISLLEIPVLRDFDSYFFANYIEGYTPLLSGIITVLYILIIILLGSRRIKKIDIY